MNMALSFSSFIIFPIFLISSDEELLHCVCTVCTYIFFTYIRKKKNTHTHIHILARYCFSHLLLSTLFLLIRTIPLCPTSFTWLTVNLHLSHPPGSLPSLRTWIYQDLEMLGSKEQKGEREQGGEAKNE